MPNTVVGPLGHSIYDYPFPSATAALTGLILAGSVAVEQVERFVKRRRLQGINAVAIYGAAQAHHYAHKPVSKRRQPRFRDSYRRYRYRGKYSSSPYSRYKRSRRRTKRRFFKKKKSKARRKYK